MRTIAVFGAGPALGMSVARRFAREGFRVALIARDQTKLNRYGAELAAGGVDVEGFTADLTDRDQLRRAVTAVKERFGVIDVAEYSPGATEQHPLGTLDVEVDPLLSRLALPLLSPIALVRQVLPEMLERGEGALLFAQGIAAKYPISALSSAGIASAGLSNYLQTLHTEVAPRGVYVGTILIGGLIERSDAQRLYDAGGFDDVDVGELSRIDPDDLADHYWDMYTKRDRLEEVVGGPS